MKVTVTLAGGVPLHALRDRTKAEIEAAIHKAIQEAADEVCKDALKDFPMLCAAYHATEHIK